jgi:hypothetical protein
MAGDIEDLCVYYVYVLYRDIDLTLPFYVGQGKGRRCFRHDRPSRREIGPRAEIARALIKQLGVVPKRIIADQLTWRKSIALEIALIKQFGRMPDGPLVNLTDGGPGRRPGAPRPPFTPTALANMSAGQKRYWQSLTDSERQEYLGKRFSGQGQRPGFKHSDDTREQMSHSHTGKSLSPSHVAAQNAGKRGHPVSMETRKKLREIMKQQGRQPPRYDPSGRKASAETKAKMSASQRRRQWERQHGGRLDD